MQMDDEGKEETRPRSNMGLAIAMGTGIGFIFGSTSLKVWVLD